MKNIIKLLLVILICGFATIEAKTPVAEIGNLNVVGNQLTDKYGKSVQLVGVSFGWSNWHPRFYNHKTVKWLKDDWNVNIVRASMGIEPEGAYLDNPHENRRLIEQVIDAAIKEGIYVIIDWHAHKIHTEKSKEFFAYMSKKYGKYPNVIYEIFNEPDDSNWEEVKEYSEEIISEIRRNDPDNIILVGCPEWDQRIDLVQKNPIIGVKNIMYTVHFYAATHHEWLRSRTDEALNAGIPVFISESAGMEASGDGNIDYVEWQRYIDWMNERKLSWIAWSVSDKDETCSMLEKSASSFGNWTDSDLKESGKKVRNYLRSYDNRGNYFAQYLWKGRVEKESETKGKLIGAASSVEFQFEGSTIDISLRNISHEGSYNYVSVEIDGQYIGRYKVDNAEIKKFAFKAKESKKNVHTIKIYKATEAAQGEVYFDGTMLTTIPFKLERKKRIEFIGDSITAGMGNDETDFKCGKGEWYDQHNAYFAYGPVLARKLDVDFLVSAVSGYGMYRNWNSEQWEESILPDVYSHLYLRTTEPMAFGNDFNPDIVSIAVGTNDLSRGDGNKERLPFNKFKFIGNYIEFVQKIYRKYPNAKVVLLTSPMVSGKENEVFVESLKEVQNFFSENSRNQPIEIFEFEKMNPKGCGYHPSTEDDKKMAEQLVPFFQRIIQ